MRKVTEDYIGTCQACFGEFKVGPDKLMVLHGYKRPGSGYAEGECVGTNELPFEYDHALTDQIIAAHRERVLRRQAYLAKLNGGEISILTRVYQVYDEGTFRHTTHQEQIGPDSKYWDRTLKIEIANVESEIRYVARLADYLQARVDAWQKLPIIGFELPFTGKERYLAKAYDPDEAEEQARKDAEKTARAAKPGKLKLIFYRPHAARPSYLGLTTLAEDSARREFWEAKDQEKKAWIAEIKAWGKENFPGKLIVRDSYDSDLPRKIARNGDFEVVSVNLDWQYVDEIPSKVAGAEPYETANKQRSFTVRREREAS